MVRWYNVGFEGKGSQFRDPNTPEVCCRCGVTVISRCPHVRLALKFMEWDASSGVVLFILLEFKSTKSVPENPHIVFKWHITWTKQEKFSKNVLL
ncbi:hypothetical protein AVEN_12591-1 [Araneus ventricosus]|uniref:Uncharacterized protein n=1 Tax=Araneus ventricosus TaxID=182803 RepID=A0A4Y2AD69_ARAVE|nr:hypothetical protein AVEN_12591-1 [Araneus ventricosus]